MGKASKTHSDKPLSSASAEPAYERFLGVVESEIIPRLMDSHRLRGDPPAHSIAVQQTDVEVFAQTLLDPLRVPAEMLLEAHLDRGVPLDAIYLNLFAPAARLLGDMWLVDLCTFSQVTLGLWRIRGMMHELSPSFHASRTGTQSRRAAERRILLATLPGQQHTMGLSVLSEFFRRDGWIALCVPSPEPGLTQTTLSAHWFDVFALSASMDSEIDDLEKTIKAARKTSQNPRLTVLVGGPLLLRRPELCDMIGADGTAADAPAAVELASAMVQVQQEVRLN